MVASERRRRELALAATVQQIGIVIADVAGKGISAALVMRMLRATGLRLGILPDTLHEEETVRLRSDDLTVGAARVT